MKKIVIIVLALMLIAGIWYVNYGNTCFHGYLETVKMNNRIYRVQNKYTYTKNAKKILNSNEKGQYLEARADGKIYKFTNIDERVALILERDSKDILLTLKSIDENQTISEILNMYGSINEISNIELNYAYSGKKNATKKVLKSDSEIGTFLTLLQNVPRSKEIIYAQIPEEAFNTFDKTKKEVRLTNIYVDINYQNYTSLHIVISFEYNTNAIYVLGNNCFILTEELSNYLQNDI